MNSSENNKDARKITTGELKWVLFFLLVALVISAVYKKDFQGSPDATALNAPLWVEPLIGNVFHFAPSMIVPLRKGMENLSADCTCNHRFRASGRDRLECMWECKFMNAPVDVRTHVKIYNATETPDDDVYISCPMNPSAHVFPHMCRIHVALQ